MVLVKNNVGEYMRCKVLLDNAANCNFVTSSFTKRLNLQRKKEYVEISGLGQSNVGKSNGSVSINFCPHFDKSKTYHMEAYIVPKISKKLPSSKIDYQDWTHIHGLQLADPEFNIPEDVDVLIGAELYYEIVGGISKKDKSANTPLAISSSLGWLIGGGKNGPINEAVICHATKTETNEDIKWDTSPEKSLDVLLKKFWEIEAVPHVRSWSTEEEKCEQHFLQTYARDKSGRFIVKYPLKSPISNLGESLPMAIRRFKQVEKRLQKNETHCKEYVQFMREYLEMGHMIEVDEPKPSSKFRNYIPHHFVLKESSTTTKFRVVFDASAKTSSGVSLNEIMMIGPVIQDSLSNLIMRFRTHAIALTADIEKMYRQILVHPDDQELQHIVWRESPDQPLKHFKILRVIYGTGPGPFLAQRCLTMLAELEKHLFPIASQVLKYDFYMDDCMTGANSVEDAIQIQSDLVELLAKGQFPIRKFASNSEAVLNKIPEDLREIKTFPLNEKDAGIKCLGIFWNPVGDHFGFKTNDLFNNENLSNTKRRIASDIARLFDPIGWLGPLIISAKVLLQSLWKVKMEWDDQVPDHIQESWDKFRAELFELEDLKIPRSHRFINKSEHKPYLVGFSDASEDAYAATVYVCSYEQNGIGNVELVSAKTKVAPIQSQSLPRLELMAAHLLSDILHPIANALKLDFADIQAYSDSTLTLGWIRAPAYKYETFVRNRVSKIQENLSAEKWGFVQGISNPADCASRGITVNELLKHELWWNGPQWLRDGPPIPSLPLDFSPNPSNGMKVVCNYSDKSHRIFKDIFTYYSSFNKLQRIAAHIFRFYNNIKKSMKTPTGVTTTKVSGVLTPIELKEGLIGLIKGAQNQAFEMDIRNLKTFKQLSSKSKLLPLNPFLDELGMLRVGGRLRHANLPMDQKHPILLPNHHILTSMIIENLHVTNMHAGPQTLLSAIQQKYWVIRGKDYIRRIIRKCVTCVRHKAMTMHQLMADLPSFRVNPTHPFQQCGIDYAGPFSIKPIAPRSKITLKAYLSIFVCCATRAIHLEVVSDATTNAFLAALRRFIARRGKPLNIYSDNGTNFVGANKELKEFQNLVKNEDHNQKIAETISKDGIMWHFNPPSAPHFGGLWEAGVKSTKFHLKRVMGQARLTFEELSTVSAQIEAILNSRPLTPESPDPSDLRALTPGHFLIGHPLTTIAEPDITELQTSRLIRWQHIQQMVQNFWRRWSSEYITRLQQRPKWMKTEESISEGTMVIVKEDNTAPLQWQLGRVIQCHTAPDGKIRTVTVKTATGEYKRPIVKLCLLPIDKSYEESESSNENINSSLTP